MSRVGLALICFFFGVFGIHRFVVGKIGTGLIWLFTGGVFGIGALVDFIMILCGTFTNSKGREIKQEKTRRWACFFIQLFSFSFVRILLG